MSQAKLQIYFILFGAIILCERMRALGIYAGVKATDLVCLCTITSVVVYVSVIVASIFSNFFLASDRCPTFRQYLVGTCA